MTLARKVRTKLAGLGRLEFWGLVFTLLALVQLPAELYLASFGPPGMSEFGAWNLVTVAYDVRHLPALFLLFLFVLIVMALVPACIVLVLISARSSARRKSGRLLGITVIAFSVVMVAAWPATDVRRAGFNRSARRMSPLVAAIRRFDAEVGRPPYDLAELTPRYLTNVDRFGVRGCRSVMYSYDAAAAAGRWQLGLDCPNGMLTLDRFVFWPSGDYPASRSVERMGEWAYFWD